MSSNPNGSGLKLEKFPDAPPTIAISTPGDAPDAGLRSLDHYKRKLPPWRYYLRQKLLPIVRMETPYLAWLQVKMRTPALDSYFAITANLGTHTFFMVVLPILFWCGYTSLGRGMVHILASGVFFTGFLKDMFSLPRPLSPPLHRITMSGSVMLEYGFPSTHSSNAVSVAVYALYTLRSPDCQLQASTKLFLEVLSYGYAFSIVLGRLYCGMHGFLDVIVGSLLGALISVVECTYGAQFDNYIHNSSWHAAAILALIIIVLIRIHPEPADDCPCFDDSVAFSGVMIGIEIGGWHYATGNWASRIPVPGTVPFDLEHLGWIKTIIRIAVGVLVIFAWREVMKPALLNSLPHLFRAIDKYGFILPRKFFMPASEYQKIPSRQKLDNVMPSVSDLPNLIKSIRHPGRGRSVSIGPQSAADAYETLAYREKRRRDSLNSENDATSPVNTTNVQEKIENADLDGSVSQVSGVSSKLGKPPTPAQSRVGSYEHLMGSGHVSFVPDTPPVVDEETPIQEPDIYVGQENELGEKEIFSRLEKPRVRYDVEVVTKLVVYAGIGILAVEVNPIIFELIGVGMRGIGHLA